MMRKLIYLVCLCPVLSLWSQSDYKEIYDLTSKVIAGDKEPVKVLYLSSIKSTDKELKPYLVRAVTLLMLASGSKKTSDYIKKIRQQNSKEQLFQFLEIPPLKKSCTDCEGHGKKLEECRKCRGGDCRNCKGKGHIVYGNGKSRVERECKICKSKSYCTYCTGTTETEADCRKCRKTGVVLNKSNIKGQSTKALKLLQSKAAQLSQDPSLTVDKQLLEDDKQKMADGEKWLQGIKNKAKKWAEKEKKRQLAAAKKNKKKRASSGPKLITMEEAGEETVEEYVEGGSTSTLDQICQEVSDYLKNQERKSGQSVFSKVYGQFLSDVPTIHIVVSDSFTRSGYDYRERSADGFYRFSLLRAERNGYEEIDFKLLNNSGKQIAGVKGGKLWLTK